MSSTPIPKSYALLRGAYHAAGYDQASFGRKIGRGMTYTNQRLAGKHPWDEDDMYRAMDLLNIPHEEMHRYFPPRGIPRREKLSQAKQGPRQFVMPR